MMSYKKFPVYFIIPILLILGMTISACQPKEVSDPVKILPGQVDDMIHVKTMKKRRQWLNQCDANNYTACAKLASDLSHFNKDGKFNETIHNEKRRLYEKACDGGHKEACNAVANYLIHYDKTATSIEAGHKILHQNCKDILRLALELRHCMTVVLAVLKIQYWSEIILGGYAICQRVKSVGIV